MKWPHSSPLPISIWHKQKMRLHKWILYLNQGAFCQRATDYAAMLILVHEHISLKKIPDPRENHHKA